MDITLRTWLLIILGTLLLIVLLDGLRRWIQHHRNPYQLSLGSVKIDDNGEDPLRHEFPKGGARPVLQEPSINETVSDTAVLTASMQVNKMGLDPLGVEDELAQEIASVETIPDPSDEAKPESFFKRMTRSTRRDAENNETVATPTRGRKKSSKKEIDLTENVPVLMDPIIDSTIDLFEQLEQEVETSEASGKPREIKPAEISEEEEAVQEVIAINIFARDSSGFQGESLLEELLKCGLRYGDMSIFHRHQSPTGEGKVLFSVANAMKPGTFKIEAMNKFSTKGLSFFFGLPGPNKPLEAFDLMYQTAQYIAKQLNGEIKDDKRSVMRAQTIEHYRQRIREFERRHLVS